MRLKRSGFPPTIACTPKLPLQGSGSGKGVGNSLQLVAAAMLGSAAVGVVRAVETLLGPMQVVYLGLCGVTPAEASRAFAARGAPGLTAYLRRLAWLSCAISVP